MNGKDARTYAIRRIRLINFHNFVDETIEVRHGGHLFLLGDNASGKTTLLDAVHYVLTAGESMEFNSAARVAGSRTEGRRAQGIILRYNVDTGALSRGGTVTYAALEVSGHRGRPFVVAIGMTAGSMDERISRWGIIRECTLEDIPFLVEDKDGTRPASRREMRDHFGKGSGFYSNVEAYKREVTQRLYVNREHFEESCRLLSMGKAYREIVANSADYHELFRRLLPEPRTELFERVIEALRTLDESAGELDNMERKYEYLLGLRELTACVARTHEDQRVCSWLAHYYTCRRLRGQVAEYTAKEEAREKALTELDRRLADVRVRQTRKEKQLADLRGADTSGLIEKEKELAADLDDVRRTRDRQAEELQALDKRREDAGAECESRREALRRAVAEFRTDLTRTAPDLPFDLTELLSGLEAAHEAELPEQQLETVPVVQFRNRALEAMRKPREELALTTHQLNLHRQEAEKLETRIAEMEGREEASPDLPGFLAAQRALREAMIDAFPLYAGLEWAAGLDRDTASAVEECIGAEVLGTFIVAPDDLSAAGECLFARFPCLRLAGANDEVDIPKWFPLYFDVARCDPQALRCLAAEMVSDAAPVLTHLERHSVLAFRGHERRLAGRPAGLVGQEGRRRAMQRQLEARRDELHEVRVQARQSNDRCEALAADLERLETFRTVLDRRMDELARDTQALRGLTRELDYSQTDLAARQERLAQVDRSVAWMDQRLTDMRALIAKQGLDKLEKKIGGVRQELQDLRTEEDKLHQDIGRIKNQLDGLAERLRNLDRDLGREQGRLAEEGAALEKQAGRPDLDDAETFALGVADAKRIRSLQAAEAAATAAERQQGEHVGELRERLKHPVYGAAFAFSYDEKENALVDRKSCGIDELTALQQQAIAEQRQVINEKTHELFRKIIMEGLLTFLKQHVVQLNDMIKRINKLLSNRDFGGNQYRFQLREVDRYKRLLDIVRRFNPFEPATEDELRQFFADHKDELFDTEVNEVPDVLDYRNWHHYDMKVQTFDHDGVVMDRRTKSVGSGGEQAVPNYLLILTIAHFLFAGSGVKLPVLIFDEAFYGIDAGRRDQLLGFASDLGLQLVVASPDQDGVKREIAYSTTLLIVKDEHYDVHLFPYHWENPEQIRQLELLAEFQPENRPLEFGEEL